MTDDTIPPAPPPVKPVSRWEDFIDILYAPADVFRRRIGTSPMVPFLVVSLVMAAVTYTMFDSMRPLMDRASAQVRASLGVPGDAPMARSATATTITKVMSVVVTPIIIGVLGLFTWFIGKIFGSQQEVSDAYTVVSYAFVPRAIGLIVGAIILLVGGASITSPQQLSLSLARFTTPDFTSPAFILASKLEVFQLWSTILIGVGLATTGRMSRTRAILATLVIWTVPTLFAVGSAMLSRSILGAMK